MAKTWREVRAEAVSLLNEERVANERKLLHELARSSVVTDFGDAN
jgi:hypothetical protein